MNANGSGKLAPNALAVHHQRQVKRALKQTDRKLGNTTRYQTQGNVALIRKRPNLNNESGDDSDDKEEEDEEFVKLLRKYALSQCKDTFKKNGIKTKDDLKYLPKEQLNEIESKLKKFKRKQFIKLVQAVSEVCKDYKKGEKVTNNKVTRNTNFGSRSGLTTSVNATNNYTSYNHYNNYSNYYNNNANIMSNGMYGGGNVETSSSSINTSMINHMSSTKYNSISNSNGGINNNSMNGGNGDESQYSWSPQSLVNTEDRILWQGYISQPSTLTSGPSVLSTNNQ